MSLMSVLKGLFHREKSLAELRGTPKFENEVMICKECGGEWGTRAAIRKAAEATGWDSSRALGVTMPCPSCGAKQIIFL